MRNFIFLIILGALICFDVVLLTDQTLSMDNRTEAIAYYNAAINAWKSRNFGEAAYNFYLANELYAYPDYHYNVGICEDLMENYKEAVRHYDNFLAVKPNGPIADFVRNRRNAILNAPTTQVWQEVGGMGDGPPQYGWVTVRQPPPATFYLYNQDWIR